MSKPSETAAASLPTNALQPGAQIKRRHKTAPVSQQTACVPVTSPDQESLAAPDQPVDHATCNPCRLCAPLGAALAYQGVADCIPFLQGGQGCATYMRRHLIGHFREPVDIASANFDESAAIFGGEKHFMRGVENVCKQYHPKLIGLATTCLAETIGEDLGRLVKVAQKQPDLPPVVAASTPSYNGGHDAGFRITEAAILNHFVDAGSEYRPVDRQLTLLPGMRSPADLRHLREMAVAMGINLIIPCDYSDKLDGGPWQSDRASEAQGTTTEELQQIRHSSLALSFADWNHDRDADGIDILTQAGMPTGRIQMPLGIAATDEFIQRLSSFSGQSFPRMLLAERDRLVDAYADGHKYLSGKKVCIYGDPDQVAAVTRFAWEIGLKPVVVATGANGYGLADYLSQHQPEYADTPSIVTEADFTDCASAIGEQGGVDLLIGPSRGYQLSRSLEIPLIRLGYPIHDRMGAARMQCLGYRGTQELFDRLCNAVIEKRQNDNPVGYLTY